MTPTRSYIPEAIITVRDSDLCPVICDPNRIYVIDPNGASISVNCMLQQLCLYRHAYLSLYQVLSRQSMCILCSVHISYSRIIIVIRKSYVRYIQSFIHIFAIFIFHISLYTLTYTYNRSYTYVILYTCHI